MSTTSLRALAVTVAAIIAVLTGIATGLLSGEKTCALDPGTAPTAATTPAATPTQSIGGAIVGAEPGTTAPGGGAKPVPPGGTQQQNTNTTAKMTCTTAAFGMEPALTAFAGTAFVGGALLLLLLLASRGRPAPAPVSPAPAAAARVSGRADTDRNTLIQAVIYVRDRVTSKALADRLGTALRDAGVETLEPTGVRFDPAHHEAGGSVPSDDPAKVGSIAAVEVPGYADRGGRILRAPVVTVYQSGYPSRGQNRGTSGTSRDRTRGEQR
jgi:hypothetical protein